MMILRKIKNNQGVTAIEYGLIGSHLSIVIMSSVALTGTDTKKTFCSVEKGLTGTYSGDCAQARVAELRSMISMFSLQISNLKMDENTQLGITDELGSEEYEEDVANAVAGLQSAIDGANQVISDAQSQLSSEEADLAIYQGLMDGYNNGTYIEYAAPPFKTKSLYTVNSDGTPGESTGYTLSQVQTFISSDTSAISSAQKTVSNETSNVTDLTNRINAYNNDEMQITKYTDETGKLTEEIDSYK